MTSVVIVAASHPTESDASIAVELDSDEETESDAEVDALEALDEPSLATRLEPSMFPISPLSAAHVDRVPRGRDSVFVPFDDRSAAGKPPPS